MFLQDRTVLTFPGKVYGFSGIIFHVKKLLHSLIKVGDVFEADGVKYKALSVTDVGDRKENLLIQGEENGKSQKGGTPVNTGEGSSDS